MLALASLVSCAVPEAQDGGAQAQAERRYVPVPDGKLAYTIVNSAGTPAVELNLIDERLRRRLVSAGRLGASGDSTTRSVEIVIEKFMSYDSPNSVQGAMAGTPITVSTVTVKEAGTGEVVARFRVESARPDSWTVVRPSVFHADRITDLLLGQGR